MESGCCVWGFEGGSSHWILKKLVEIADDSGDLQGAVFCTCDKIIHQC